MNKNLNLLQQQNSELLRQLTQIKSSKFFKFWQFYCHLKERWHKLTNKDLTYDYYHKNTFWNDHPLICQYLNELATGDKNTDWIHYLYNHYFKYTPDLKMLSLVCGNGWLDRDLDKIFNFQQIVGYDISRSLIKEAKSKSYRHKFSYHLADLNSVSIKERGFDLAINLAGLHHIENMDHAVHQIYRSLKNGGIFANFDYIGPKRNQYSDIALKYMNQMQLNFPASLVGREPICRPSLEVMLQEDPSEAVGSELIIPTLKKYFRIDYLRYLNGGMLYQVLYNHIQNFSLHRSSHNRLLLKNITLEKNLTRQGKVKSLFAFIICQKSFL